jgi:predicted DNA-binding transcriptional regulator YafY
LGTAERRNEILKLLCRRRYETISNLAFEFGVSDRTIRRDIEVLSLTEPIYTQSGRYGGGVYVMDGYHMNRMYMSERELGLLHKIYDFASIQEKCTLTKDELTVFKRIIEDYSKPEIKKGNIL